MNDFSVVLGVDTKTVGQLRLTLPTWFAHKPSLMKRDFVVFYDRWQVAEAEVLGSLHPLGQPGWGNVTLVRWPWAAVTYEDQGTGKWGSGQRAKMLSGFIHVAANHVKTPYWLKIDTDVAATGNDDWIDPRWLTNDYSIVAPGWGYTKPGDQMMELDQWVDDFKSLLPLFEGTEPLNLRGEPDGRVCHPRIISRCAFFETSFTQLVAKMCDRTVEDCKMPVPSQDGFIWYCAKRSGRTIHKVGMFNLGWRVVSHRWLQRGLLDKPVEGADK